jgi:hypothetical protein
MMDKRTVASAHTRIDSLEKELIEVKTEVKIQFKEVFTRIKRIESLLIGAAGTIIAMLVAVLMKMG